MSSGSVPPVPWWKTDFGEEEIRYVAESVRNRRINHGANCEELERRLADCLDVPHVAMTASGSAALLVSLLACEVGPGDEVILPAETFIATAHAALLAGARVKLVDVLPDRPVMDAAQLDDAITERTKVILPVHLGGHASQMGDINAVAKRHGLRVIEDAAQAFCSKTASGCLGTLGDAGTFSMSLTKLIPTGEGGFIATRDADLDARVRRLRNQGVQNIADNRFDSFGFNLRFNDILASIGLAQLSKLPEKIAAVNRIYQTYCEHLDDLSYLRMLRVDLESGELPVWSQAVCSDRDKVIRELNQRGIQARAFHPCLADSPHLQVSGDFPNARFFAKHALTLPSGPDQSDANLQRTIDTLRGLRNEIPTSIDSLGWSGT